MVYSILIPLFSAFLGAVASVISKTIIDRTGYAELTNLSFLSMSLIMIPVMPFLFSLNRLNLAIPIVAIIVILDAVANLLFFKGLAIEQVSRANALLSLSPLFTAFLTPLILPEQFGIGVFLAALGITLSVYFIQTGHGLKQFIGNFRHERNYLIIGSAFIFGFTAIPVRLALNELALTNAPTLYWVRAIGIFMVTFAIVKPDITGLDRRVYSIIGIKSVFVIFSWVLMFYSIANFNLIYSYALARTVPFFVLIIAWKKLGDSLNRGKIIGIITLIISIFLTKLL